MTILVKALHVVLLLREKPRTLQFLHQYDLPLVLCLCSHPTRRDIPSINKPCNLLFEGELILVQYEN
jgi:hypothetical protein